MHQLLQDRETSVLVDILAEYTEKFTHLFRNYTGIEQDSEYQNCKKVIQYIILELEKRGMLSKSPLTSVPTEGGQSLPVSTH